MNRKEMDPPPFPGLVTPEPDPRLRTRVLRAARQAAAAETRLRPWQRWIDRLWANHALHVAWLVAILTLFVVNATVERDTSAVPVRLTDPTELQAHTADVELSDARRALIREGI